MLQSDVVIWLQRYQRSDLKRGSISLARQIESAEVASATYELEVGQRISRQNDFDGRQIRKKYGCDWLIVFKMAKACDWLLYFDFDGRQIRI
jgi:hypothetical protein